jgi:hypothetical protein
LTIDNQEEMGTLSVCYSSQLAVQSQQIKETVIELATSGKLWFQQQSPKRQKVIVWSAIAALVIVPGCLNKGNRQTAVERAKASVNAQAQTSAKPERKLSLLVNHPKGYDLYTDGSCLVIKGLTDGMLRSHGTDLNSLKNAYKQEYGFTCVLFE